MSNPIPSVRHRTVTVSDIRLFYREAGCSEMPTLILLHGFPSSSHQFRYLLPALADRWHVVAPDFPAFGYRALYLHAYGAQVGFRLAMRTPDRVTALVIQNS